MKNKTRLIAISCDINDEHIECYVDNLRDALVIKSISDTFMAHAVNAPGDECTKENNISSEI